MRFWLYLLLVASTCSSCIAARVDDSRLHHASVCYGRTFIMPSEVDHYLILGSLYFTPSKPPGPARLVMQDRKIKDKRYKEFSFLKLKATYVTERDEGIFSILFDHDNVTSYNILKLTIKDCSDEVRKYYGQEYRLLLPSDAYSLEFSSERAPLVALWNRTDPGAPGRDGGGRVEANRWVIKKVTQQHGGHYTLRGRDQRVTDRYKLIVSERNDSFVKESGDDLVIKISADFVIFSLTFSPNDKSPIDVMKHGTFVTPDPDEWRPEEHLFHRRISPLEEPYMGVIIYNLQSNESGTFRLRDADDNLMLVAHLKVLEHDPLWKTLWKHIFEYRLSIIAAVAGAMILCCWCCYVKRTCCKKSSTKANSNVAQRAAALRMLYHHDCTTQLSGPSDTRLEPSIDQPSGPKHHNQYSANTYPSQTSGSACLSQPLGPTSTSQTASTIPDPQVSATAEQSDAPTFPVGSDWLSSDSMFKLDRLTFPSAALLSSDTSSGDVYTSDKLNFL